MKTTSRKRGGPQNSVFAHLSTVALRKLKQVISLGDKNCLCLGSMT